MVFKDDYLNWKIKPWSFADQINFKSCYWKDVHSYKIWQFHGFCRTHKTGYNESPAIFDVEKSIISDKLVYPNVFVDPHFPSVVIPVDIKTFVTVR